ncbi:hypothetical protein ACTOWA_02020 [Herbaspirillum seropedicae]|uniref:hypothetical protein n=1 Tax=Herbaspirillum seropedicae TaxID=964 RepID=UPI003F8D1E75
MHRNPSSPADFPSAGAPRPHVLTAQPMLYLLVRAHPPASAAAAEGRCEVMCESIAVGSLAGRDAMVVYLSPLEADIDAAWNARSGGHYQVLAVHDFLPDELLRQHRDSLPYCLHIGWGARDGRLAVRRDGGLVRVSAAALAWVSADVEAVRLVVEPFQLESRSRLWEGAGLYAHAEVEAKALTCTEPERRRHAQRAIVRLPGTVAAPPGINQLALYDLESAHWHFVPLSLAQQILSQQED